MKVCVTFFIDSLTADFSLRWGKELSLEGACQTFSRCRLQPPPPPPALPKPPLSTASEKGGGREKKGLSSLMYANRILVKVWRRVVAVGVGRRGAGGGGCKDDAGNGWHRRRATNPRRLLSRLPRPPPSASPCLRPPSSLGLITSFSSFFSEEEEENQKLKPHPRETPFFVLMWTIYNVSQNEEWIRKKNGAPFVNLSSAIVNDKRPRT